MARLVMLISGDTHLLAMAVFEGVPILRPREALLSLGL